MKISVIGAGSWGIAATKMLSENGHDVTLWSFSEKEVDILQQQRENPALLPGVKLPERVRITGEISCAQGADIVVVAVPSFAVFETAQKLRPFVNKHQVMVLLSKGFDKNSGYSLLSDLLQRVFLGEVPIVALTGPSHAEEVGRGVPTAVVAASMNKQAAELVQEAFMNHVFRVYTTPDIVGAELGGAMKNIMALAVGISDGAGYGDNTKAMLMTRGITEMARFGVAMGGQNETFAGLSGIGDLIVTCISEHSRNRRAGLLIGGGASPEEAIKQVGAVVEGYFAAQAVFELSKNMDIELPICRAVYDLLYQGVSLEDTVDALMNRGKKHEIEESWMKHINW
ncbi:NAD(P)H-dependent glycerol-3-phosphate dehydrogenase [Acidaminobacterium chupaoyuni]